MSQNKALEDVASETFGTTEPNCFFFRLFNVYIYVYIYVKNTREKQVTLWFKMFGLRLRQGLYSGTVENNVHMRVKSCLTD